MLVDGQHHRFMQQVTVTFEQIFDVFRAPSSLLQVRRTAFSFSAGGEVHRHVSVPGRPTLQVGHTITALLRKNGRWDTLVGWVNHDNGEIAKPSTGRTLRRAGVLMLAVGVLVAVVYAVFAVDANPLSRNEKWLLWSLWGGYAAFLVLLGGIVAARRIRRRRDVQRLEQCLLDLHHSDAAYAPPAAASEAVRPVSRSAA